MLMHNNMINIYCRYSVQNVLHSPSMHSPSMHSPSCKYIPGLGTEIKMNIDINFSINVIHVLNIDINFDITETHVLNIDINFDISKFRPEYRY